MKVFFKWKSETFLSVGKWKLTNAGERESQLCLISLELCEIPMHWFQIQHLPQPPSCLFLNHHSSYPTILRSFKMSTREWHISDESRFVFHLHIVSFVGLYKLEKITVFMKPELLYLDIEKITLEVKVYICLGKVAQMKIRKKCGLLPNPPRTSKTNKFPLLFLVMVVQNSQHNTNFLGSHNYSVTLSK